MSQQTPTVSEISTNITNQIASEISQAVPLLPKGFTRVLAKVLAAVFILVYKYANFSLLQMFVATASAKDTVINGKTYNPLEEWGKLLGVGTRNKATRWEGTATINVLNQTGTLDAGQQLLRSDTGVLYVTLSAVPLDAPTKTITLRAASDQDGNGGAGTLGNLADGATISFANPQANVAEDAVVLATTVTGADAEDVEVYRQRIIDRAQAQPQGGAYADYRIWASDVEGVLSIFPYTGQKPGHVDVYVEATEASSGNADGIPTAAQLAAVSAAIELDIAGLASNRPVNALVNAIPISRSQFNITVTGLVADDISEAQTTIGSALDDYLRSREPFINGLSVLPREDRVTQGSVAGIAHSAASGVGATLTQVTLQRGISQLNAYTLGNGEKAKLGTINFI